MKYVLCYKNEFALNGYEYFGMGDDNLVVSYHNPSKADSFTSREKAMELAEKFTLPSGDKLKVDLLDKHVEIFLRSNFVFRKFPLLKGELNRKYNGEGIDEVINWWFEYMNAPKGSVSFDVRQTWPKLYKVCDHLWEVVYYENNDSKENYISVEFCVKRTSNLESFRAEILKVIDRVTLVDKKGYKVLYIIDHELNRFEMRKLFFKTENDCLIKSRWDNNSLKPKSMEKCFEEIKEFYYYE